MIVAFGDSLTAGQGVPAGASYPDFLRRLMARAGRRAQVLNAGVCGDTSLGGLHRVEDVLRLRPSWVVLELGGNDGLRGWRPVVTLANLHHIIARLRARHIHVLLAGIAMPPGVPPTYARAFQRVFGLLARRHHLPLLPFLYQDLVLQMHRHPALLQTDGIHATARGNRIVAATVWRYLQPLLRKMP
ncbi:MAG: arylesterase [Terriglobales bacterium]